MEIEKATDDKFEEFELTYLLPMYYKRIFPTNLIFRWMSYGLGEGKYFANREFSFTLADDVYLRYQSFLNQQQLEQALQKKCPFKIDIGAVYNCRPSANKTCTTFQALEKELVFDIDMTDYDEVRKCCSGANVCAACWPFMTVAIRIIDRALREDFGFDDILWVFSGRRGVHCWVCDKRARLLSAYGRAAVAGYLSVVRGGKFMNKKVKLGRNLHPSIQNACDIIKDYFPDLILSKQRLLDSDEDYKKIVALANTSELRQSLQECSKQSLSSEERWDQIVHVHEETTKKSKMNKDCHFLEEVTLQLCYPRLDIEVTKGLNHLLKAPFSVHPKTGRVCVPIDVQNLSRFDPFKVPTVKQVCEEIRASAKSGSNRNDPGTVDKVLDANKAERGYLRTSLAPSIRLFEKFIQKLERSHDVQNNSAMEF